MNTYNVSSIYSPVYENRVDNTKEEFGGMGGNEFMQLLLIQLRHQNPLEPMDDSALLAQFTQLNSLDQLRQINENLISLAKSKDLLDAAGLIGKVIEADIVDDQTAIGTVGRVSMFEGEVMLWLGNQSVPLSSVIAVREE